MHAKIYYKHLGSPVHHYLYLRSLLQGQGHQTKAKVKVITTTFILGYLIQGQSHNIKAMRSRSKGQGHGPKSCHSTALSLPPPTAAGTLSLRLCTRR